MRTGERGLGSRMIEDRVEGRPGMRKPIAVGFMVAYLVLLLGLTLGGFYQARAPMNWVPLKSIAHDLRAGGRHLVVNFLGNLVAFLPMGVLVPSMVAGRRPIRDVVLGSFGLSLAIEVLQGILGRRIADVDDVILNTVGGLAGYTLWQSWRISRARAQKA